MASLRTVMCFGVLIFAVLMVSTTSAEEPTTTASSLNITLPPADEILSKLSDFVHSFNSTATQLFGSLSEKAQEQIKDATEKLKQTAEDLKEKFGNKVDTKPLTP
uniref:Uncharacterized protein n=1 Tax=Cacopsylla melanoneura TaxID=428564 RepID=A0A8D8VM49_9HEMI